MRSSGSRRLARRAWAAAPLALMSAAVLVASPASAAQSPLLTWSAPVVVDDNGTEQLNAIACPSSTECVATDQVGHEVRFDPQSPGSASTLPIQSEYNVREPLALSCLSANSCLELDSGGYTFDFNPQSAAINTNGSDQVDNSGGGRDAVDCIDANNCIGAGTHGEMVDVNSTDLTGAASQQLIDSPNKLTGVACLSLSQSECIAVDSAGQVVPFEPNNPSHRLASAIDTSGGGLTAVPRRRSALRSTPTGTWSPSIPERWRSRSPPP